MEKYRKQSNPIRIPVPGNKLIEEHFGKVSTETSDFSLAHMHAPAGWGEPAQTPDFDEITLMISGCMRIIVDQNDIIELEAGESFVSYSGTRIQYSNPYPEENEYWSVCMPAFSPDTVHREE